MAYVDIFVGPVRADRKDAYITYARAAGSLALKAGALSAAAYWGSEVPHGILGGLAAAANIERDETLVARVVRWNSREARDAGWAEMMKSSDMQSGAIPVPFDRSRVFHGGFEELADI